MQSQQRPRRSQPRSAPWTAAAVLLAALCVAAAAQTQQALPADRSSGPFAPDCGADGRCACSGACMVEGEASPAPAWCPSGREPSGCLPGLMRVSATPSAHLSAAPMPDVCLTMPKEGVQCGVAGAPCCLAPGASGNTRTLIRALCEAPLTCMVSEASTAIPYGGPRHIETVLQHANTSSALLSRDVMGTCLQLPAAGAGGGGGSLEQQQAGRNNTALGECGTGLPPCPAATYCASNEDHQLGGARCLPLPACGGPYEACCPPHYSGEVPQRSIVDGQTAMPTCKDADSVCVWPPTVQGFDAAWEEAPDDGDSSSSRPGVGLSAPANAAAAARQNPDEGSVSMTAQFPRTLCLPKVARCGGEGQPCCPHSQFASSNAAFYFRLHVCDAALTCNATIQVFAASVLDPPVQPVLGVCQQAAGADARQPPCGGLGQRCCKHVDRAGWEWQECAAGLPGLFCAPNGTCSRCPSADELEAGRAAAVWRPGVANTC